AGATADNYSFSYVAGDYRIVPAGSLVVTASGAAIYGESVTYSVSGAKYMNGSSVLFTLGAPIQSGNTFTFDDGVGGETTLTLSPDSPVLSGSTNLAAGRYDLAATAVSSTSNNYGAAIAVVGSHEVSQRDLTVTAAGLTKVYDGSTDMVNLSLSSNALAGDRISLSASSAYADKNVDASKPYAVSNIATSGLDAGN
ncbi:MAG: YDG domain-containing protein, partial [Burkholderiaceae bacterium]